MDQRSDLPPNPAPMGRAEAWRGRMAQIGQMHGEFRAIGTRHFALLLEDGPHLVVTFDNAARLAPMGAEGVPLGLDLAGRGDVSVLSLMSVGATWFRDRDLFDYLDTLLCDGFFDSFDRVTFIGIGPTGGFAAAGFSVLAPASDVLLSSPVATLAPKDVPFETRFAFARRLDFTTRFGYAPDLVAAAGRVVVLYDPRAGTAASHAALFRGPRVQKLRLPHYAPHLERLILSGQGIAPLFTQMANSPPPAQIAPAIGALIRARAHADGAFLTHLANIARSKKHGAWAAGILARGENGGAMAQDEV